MSWFYYRPYQSVAQRQAKAKRVATGMAKRGEKLSPVVGTGTKLVRTFWGKAWCDHIGSFSDFANRLPKGKSYLRSGAVIDLQVLPGRITAKVVGSETYEIDCPIDTLPAARWADIKRRCGGQIGSLVELLQGKLSSSVMGVVTDADTGLFPRHREMRLKCSCPDSARLCKHLAAALYGIGIRLDDAPELLFKLRGVDHVELITAAAAPDAGDAKGRKTLAADELADVFGIELAAPAEPPSPPKPAARATVKKVAKRSGKPAAPKAKKVVRRRPV